MIIFEEPLKITAPKELFDPAFLAEREAAARKAATVAAFAAGAVLIGIIILSGKGLSA